VLRRVYLLVGALGEDGALVSFPHPLWSGFVDSPEVRVGQQNVIRVTCESHLAAFERSNGALFNDADQQALYAGDVGFEFLEQLIDAKLIWGGATKNYSGGSTVGPGDFPPGFTDGQLGGLGDFDTR